MTKTRCHWRAKCFRLQTGINAATANDGAFDVKPSLTRNPYGEKTMKLRTLQDLLAEELKDLHNAEMQLVRALPKMAKAASSEELVEAFENHLEETKHQVERLDQIFERLDIKPGRKKCKAMEGLLEEGKDTIAEDAEPMVHDAALIAAAQRVEHYEIAGYGCAKAFALLLEDQETADLLDETLQEESAANEKLTEIAMSGINQAAMTAESDE
jgi:ferritin-like metal-binding protein YciE